MSARRELLVAALLCAAGGAFVVTAAGRSWAEVRISGAGTPLSQPLSGRELTGAAGALGWAGLAGLAALFAVRGRVRVAVGALLAVFGGGAAYASVTAIQRAHVLTTAADKSSLADLAVLITQQPESTSNVQTGVWWSISVAGGVLIVVAGLLTIVRGAGWPEMSARYDAPGTSAAPTATGATEEDPSRLWKSLDRGEDPTERSDG